MATTWAVVTPRRRSIGRTTYYAGAANPAFMSLPRPDMARSEIHWKNLRILWRLSKGKKELMLSEKDALEKAGLISRKRTANQLRKMFVTAVHHVCLVIRIGRIIQVTSMSHTLLSAVETRWHTLHTSKEARKLAFNPAMYATSKTVLRVPNWALAILNRDPNSRTLAECRRIHALLRPLACFDKFTAKIQLALCRGFTYQHVEAPRIILREGHLGYHFYLIYSGSVFVNVLDRNPLGDYFSKTETVLSRGDAFGELALLKGCRRAATVTCRENCELLVVTKHLFAQVCPKIFDTELVQKVDFVSEMKLFNSKYWSEDSLHKICFEAQIQEYKTNKVIVTNSQEDDWMYILMAGKCRIVKSLPLDDEEDFGSISDTNSEDSDPLVAEFMHSMRRRSSEKQTRNPTRRQSSLHPLAKKAQLLQSLALDYVDGGKRKRDLYEANEDDKERSAMDAKKEIPGVVTLHALMIQRAHAHWNQEHVYLDIGTMKPKDIFNLYNIIHARNSASATSGGSSLLLVSCGAKLLRLKQKTFFSVAKEGAFEHARLLSASQRYPSDEVLLASYKQKSRWDKYKHRVVRQVVNTLKRDSRRHQTNPPALSHAPLLGVGQDGRLLSTLQKRGRLERYSADSDSGPLSPDEPKQEDIQNDNFESRMYKEADIKNNPHDLTRFLFRCIRNKKIYFKEE